MDAKATLDGNRYRLDTAALADGYLVQLPDGTSAYYAIDPEDGRARLYRRVVAADPGDNVIRERLAPAKTAGILDRAHHEPPLTSIYLDPIGIVA